MLCMIALHNKLIANNAMFVRMGLHHQSPSLEANPRYSHEDLYLYIYLISIKIKEVMVTILY